jgi:hypothetical protein
MDRQSFRDSLNDKSPPSDLSLALQGLWHAAKGRWHEAHECAQAQEDQEGAWVHAHLHRQEGDLANAGFWYRRAGKSTVSQSLEAEWNAIVDELLPEPE